MPRKVEHLFDLDAVTHFLVRLDIRCTDARAMKVFDAIRGEFPGIIEGMYGWCSDDHEQESENTTGTFQALALTCEEGESLPKQLDRLRQALSWTEVGAWAREVTGSPADFAYEFPANKPLPVEDEWEAMK